MTNDKTFHELWRDLGERSRRWAIPIVQDYKELEYIFNLMKDCSEYLEVGTAEGNSLYVLSHALQQNNWCSHNWIIDFGEKHTAAPRKEVIERLEISRPKLTIHEIYGNSHNSGVIKQMEIETGLLSFDAVLIDAGHTYEDVIADSIAYGHLATKYIIFHDICLPDVRKAYDWYLKQNPQFKHHEFINSTSFGYGIIEV